MQARRRNADHDDFLDTNLAARFNRTNLITQLKSVWMVRDVESKHDGIMIDRMGFHAATAVTAKWLQLAATRARATGGQTLLPTQLTCTSFVNGTHTGSPL